MEAPVRDSLAALLSGWGLETVQPPGQPSASIPMQWAIPAYHRTASVPDQGFKLHISATLANVEETLERIVPFLLAQHIDFKVVATLEILELLNRGQYGLPQVGKIITIYPESTDQALSLAKTLHEMTRGLVSPRIPTDHAFASNSVVFYRYGVMGKKEDLLVRPDGTIVPDDRSQLMPVPDWITNPFTYPPPVSQASQPLFAGRFVIVGNVVQRGGGGVYRAVELTSQSHEHTVSRLNGTPATGPGRLVMVKEARLAGEMTREGFSSIDRLRWQAQMLDLFADVPAFPKVYDLFDHQENLYLVLEHITGPTLHEILIEGTVLPVERVLRLGLKMARLLTAMHRRGVVYGDLSPANVIIDDHDHVHFFDLEHAYFVGRPWQAQGGTPGFYPPLASQSVAPERDLYALAALLSNLLMPRWYTATMDQLARGANESRAWARPELPSTIAEPIRDLVERLYRAHSDDDAITLDESIDRLQTWSQSGHPHDWARATKRGH